MEQPLPPALRAGVVVAAIVMVGLLVAMVAARSCGGAVPNASAIPGVPIQVEVRTIDVAIASPTAPPTPLMACLGITVPDRDVRVHLDGDALACVEAQLAPGAGAMQTLIVPSGQSGSVKVESRGGGSLASRQAVEVAVQPEARTTGGIRLAVDVSLQAAEGRVALELQDLGIPIGTSRERVRTPLLAPGEAIAVWLVQDQQARLILVRAAQRP